MMWHMWTCPRVHVHVSQAQADGFEEALHKVTIMKIRIIALMMPQAQTDGFEEARARSSEQMELMRAVRALVLDAEMRCVTHNLGAISRSRRDLGAISAQVCARRAGSRVPVGGADAGMPRSRRDSAARHFGRRRRRSAASHFLYFTFRRFTGSTAGGRTTGPSPSVRRTRRAISRWPSATAARGTRATCSRGANCCSRP